MILNCLIIIANFVTKSLPLVYSVPRNLKLLLMNYLEIVTEKFQRRSWLISVEALFIVDPLKIVNFVVMEYGRGVITAVSINVGLHLFGQDGFSYKDSAMIIKSYGLDIE